ncbi:thiol:disulfide interchange protein DsbG [Oleiagrimonas sp. C23AA]|uniref:thiol:disulfide interchange protein DsbG n=1 Tax=Oleiagrimonas sp. C23AA TaxID=2719047 RepID=UPI0014214C00|nr:thiol:disulfide interchange protein DsbG [Oleiagrimonas sp. C23AA]NII09520.1 thiol:disulfide interchange protein DsbG [Oleiagrimonas sp. C23AA]
MKHWLPLLALGLVACSQASDAPNTYPAPIQALQNKGVKIKSTMQAPPGFKGYLGEYAGHPVPVYLLPDGKHVSIGELFDSAGEDVTQQALQEATQQPLGAATWNQLGKATWIAEGATHPKHVVYVFTDTECPFCHRLWAAVQPILSRGDTQVRYILVAVISPKSEPRAASILDAANPLAAMKSHEAGFRHSPVKPSISISSATQAHIQANTRLMSHLGFQGTPATVYKDDKGRIRTAVGMLPQTRVERIFGR